MHIALRRWTGTPGAEEPSVGEPFWDPLGSRIGVFNNVEGRIEWMPIVVGNNFTLNRDQVLRGIDGSGNVSEVAIRFSAAGKVQIVNTVTSVVYAEFGPEANVFHAVEDIPSPLVSRGLINHVVNAGMQAVRGLIPVVGGAIDTSLGWSNPRLLAPNWIVFKAPGSSGHIRCTVHSGDKPAGVSGVFRVAKVVATGAPTQAGIRFVMDGLALSGKQCTASVYVKGPVGRKFEMRISSPTNGVIITQEHTVAVGGGHVRYEVKWTHPDQGDRWAFFDVQAFSKDSAVQSDWFVAAPMAHRGNVAWPWEARDGATEKATVDSLYSEHYVLYDSDNGEAFSIVQLPLADGTSPRFVVQPSDSSTITVTEFSNRYAKLVRTDPSTGKAWVKLMAYHAPATPEIP